MPYTPIAEKPTATPTGGYNPITPPASSGYNSIDSTSPKTTTPAVAAAVNKVSPSLLSKIGSFVKNVADFGTTPKTPSPALQIHIATGPKSSDIDTNIKNINSLKSKIENTKVDTTSQESIDNYNGLINEYNQKNSQASSDIDAYNKAQKVQGVLNQNYVDTPYTTPMKELSHDLSQVFNEPIAIAGEVLGSTKAFQSLAKGSDAATFLPSFTEELAKHLQTGTEAISGLTGGVIQPNIQGAPDDASTKLFSVLSQGIGMAVGLGSIEGAGSVNAPKAILDNFQDYPKIQQLFNGLAKSIPAFAAYGQLNPNLEGISDRLKTLGTDIATAIPYTALGLTSSKTLLVPASAALGFGMAKLSGASNKDAAVSATALGLLSLMGESNNQSKEVITQAQAKGQLFDEALNTINKFSDEKITADSSIEDIKRAFKNAALKTHPDVGGNAKDFSSVTYARDILLGEGKTTEAKITDTKTPEDITADIKKTAEDIKNPVTTESEFKPDIQNIAANFAIKTPEVEGLDKDQATKLTPDEAHPLAAKVADTYFKQSLNPVIKEGKAIIIGSDNLKDYFGKDYNLNNHPVYSQAANLLYTKAVSLSKNPVVKFTVGGTGSGKSDFLVPDLSDKFNGVIYDSTGFNYDGIKQQIDYAKSLGKTPEVYAIIPDLQRSRAYTFMREAAGEHPVTEAAFIRTHSQAIETLKKLINDGVEVNILDTRNLTTKEAVRNADYVENPLELLNSLGYTEDNVRNKISNISKENSETFIKEGKNGIGEVPKENRSSEINSNEQTGISRSNRSTERSEQGTSGPEGRAEGTGQRPEGIQPNSEEIQIAFRRGGERVEDGADSKIQAREISENLRGSEGNDLVSPALARKIIRGEGFELNTESEKVLKAFGYSDQLVEKLKFYQSKNAFSKIAISSNYGSNENYEALFDETNNTIVLSPKEIDNPLFKSGDIVDHEAGGHSWYSKLSPEGRNSFYEVLKQNKDVIKEAWEQGVNPHFDYWNDTVRNVYNAIKKSNSESLAKKIVEEFGLELDNNIFLDDFINKTLNLDKKIEAINKELTRLGENTINLKAEDTAGVKEHIAMIAENAKDLVPSEEGLLSNYIEDVNNGTLKYGPTAERALTYQGETDLSTTILEKLKGRDTVSKTFISELTNSGDIKQVERDMIREVLAGYPDGAKIPVAQFAKDVKIELLPLSSFQSGVVTGNGTNVDAQYEHVTLPEDIRGNVANYEERVYESPVKTSAGGVHFNRKEVPNYFGHTRIEDMASNEGIAPKEKTEEVSALKEFLSQFKNPLESALEGQIEPEEDTYLPSRDENFAKNLKRSENRTSLGKTPALKFLKKNYGISDIEPIESIQEAINNGQKLGYRPEDIAHYLIRNYVPGGIEYLQAGGKEPNLDKFYKSYGVGNTPSSIRRVIEVQSDLYQKGRLENEKIAPSQELINMEKDHAEGKVSTADFRKAENEFYRQRDNEISKLSQYNDPTAHFRMVREEIRKAAQDGKTKLQFPTGETAMKIEGLGNDSGMWYNIREDGNTGLNLKESDLKVGKEIKSGPPGNWIITDVLGDGKFKAVPKDKYEAYDIGGNTNPAAQTVLSHYSETFDISGKVDTNNPIYKFYEKDLGRYLKNKYDAKPVTDDKGVTWNEVAINPDMAEAPVIAFRQKTQDINQLNKMLEREQESLAIAEANPEQHARVYGPDRIQKYKDRIAELKDRIAQAKNPVFNTGNKLEDLRKTLENVENRVGVQNAPTDFNGNSLRNLGETQIKLEAMKDAVDNSPLKSLEKYEAKSGIFKGELPEVTGKSPEENRKSKLTGSYKDENVLKFIQKGDQLIQEAGFNDSEEARAAYLEYTDLVQRYQSELKHFSKDVKQYKSFIRQDEKSLEQTGKQIPITLDELEPPIVRGEFQSPKLDFRKWKDKGMIALNRDTLERNLEKIAPKEDADKIKKFLIEPVRENELARTKFNNELKTSILKKMKELGLKRNTTADELIQIFGEGKMSLDELKKAAPKNWEQIQSAAGFFRNIYDDLLKVWNDERKKFNYPAIPKVPNYFRHFQEIGFLIKNYGILSKQDELPMEIAGKTEFFKPGKPFSTAEMHRTGDRTKFSAIGGFNNYIESVSKQIFHIDSVQRGRAIERYMDASAELARRNGEPLLLSNTIANLRGYINNQLAGKTATLDRALEDTFGRDKINAFQTFSKLVGKSIIVGNLSTALSHLVTLPLIGATTDKVPLVKGAMTTLTSPLKAEPFSTIDGQESSFLVRRFPLEEIMPSMPKTAEKALSYLFIVTDKFKSRLAVSSKYYEGIGNGLTPKDAMKQADIYAGKVLGDYSVGQKPNLMNAKTATLLAQFQLGLNDSMSVLLHDIPESATYETKNEKGETIRKKKKWQIASKLIQFAIFSYLFNLVLKQIRGSGKGIDPIDLGLTLTGLNDEGAGQSIPKRVALAGSDLAGELPFTSLFTGNFPTATAISQPVKDLMAGNYAAAAEDVLASVGSPIGGGLQAQKTIKGAQAIANGEAPSTAQKAKDLFFGASASVSPLSTVSKDLKTKAKTAQTKLAGFDPAVVQKVQSVFDEAQKDGFGTPEADTLVNDLTDNEYKVYQAIKASYVAQNNVNLESKVLPIVQQANSLGFGTPEADKLVADSFPETPEGDTEYAAYTSIKNSLYGQKDQKNTSLGTWDKQSFVDHIANIAKAVGTDPVTAFNDIFAGNSSWRIIGQKNGQILVQRMSEAQSEAIKKSEGGDTKEYKLDHSVPLEIGGNNGTDNLQLIPTDQWSSNSPVEDYLGKALGEGNVTGPKARELIIRYKAGAGEILSPALQKEYKDKYKSEPITFDEIKSEVK